MKKIFFGLIALLSFNASIMAQAVKQAPAKTTDTKIKAAPAASTKMAKPAATGTVVLKKDGTADKRYKNTATRVPLKKDGTPDKRFKANKKS